MTPNAPGTPRSTVRIPPDFKARVQAKAALRGETFTDAIMWGLEQYLARDEHLCSGPQYMHGASVICSTCGKTLGEGDGD